MSAVAKRKLTIVDGGDSAANPPAGGGGGARDPEAWRSQLILNREHRIEGSLHNIQLIIEHDERLAGMFWLDEFANQILLSRDPPWIGGTRDEFTDQDAYELAAWLQHPDQYAMKADDKQVLKAVSIVSRRHRRHPPREYLRSLKWDGEKRVSRVLVDIFGADDRDYNLRASECWLVSAVARILTIDPLMPSVGAQVDFMLVLEGGQGKKKTSTVRALFGAPWYVELHESPSNNDFYQIMRGCWCVEIAELQSFRGADITAVKAAITRRVDKYRAPYERAPRSWRRECIFVGTTNDSEYLRDPTGARRFLPVFSGGEANINLARAQAERDQIWAEAVAMLDAGFPFWELPGDIKEEQEKRYIEDSWEPVLRRWLLGWDKREHAYPVGHEFATAIKNVTMADAMRYSLGIEVGKQTPAEQRRFSDVMKRLGWKSTQKTWEARSPKERRWHPVDDAWAEHQVVEQAGASGTSGGDDAPPF